MTERDFQKEFSQWIEAHPQPTTTFELKICKGPSIRFDALAEHQAEALYDAKHSMTYHKINDMPFGTPCEKCGYFNQNKIRFTNPKPFDCFVMAGVNAYVVVWKYVPRTRTGQRIMIWIDVDNWLAAAHATTKKSIKIDELCKQGKVVYF